MRGAAPRKGFPERLRPRKEALWLIVNLAVTARQLSGEAHAVAEEPVSATFGNRVGAEGGLGCRSSFLPTDSCVNFCAVSAHLRSWVECSASTQNTPCGSGTFSVTLGNKSWETEDDYGCGVGDVCSLPSSVRA